MKQTRLAIALLVAFCSISCSFAANIPVGGKSMLREDIVEKHHFYYKDKAASLKISGKDTNPVFQITTLKKYDYFYGIQLVFPANEPVKKGDILLISFRVRSLSSEKNGIGAFQVYFQKNSRNWHKCISEEARTDKNWRTYYFPFKADRNLKKGEAELCFGLGLYKQQIELADIRFLNYKNNFKIEDMPGNDLSMSLYAYKGMKADAVWRKKAAERIEKIRKADIVVNITQNGKKVKDAEVSITMKRHAFLFGSAINMRFLRDNTVDAKIFREKFLELFNSGGPENALKWPPLAGDWGTDWRFQNTMKSLEWLKKHNIKIRGHVLLWPSWKQSPKFLRQYDKNPEQLKKVINKHIDDITQKCKPFLYEWDVINEPFTNNDLMKLLGNEVMAEWFVAAHKSVPQTQLYLNDYNILTKPHGKHYAFVKSVVEKLIAAKAPINGLGLQSHFGAFLNPPEDVLKTLDDLSKYNLKLKITEFDVNIGHQELVANYTRDFMTAIFSHPSIHGFQMWGFWAGAHWRPKTAMYDRAWRERPNLKAYKRVVFKDWWTDVAGKSDKNGKFQTRGFLGNYEITVKLDNKVKKIKKTLDKSGIEIDVKF